MTTNTHQRPLLLPPLLWPRALPKPQAFRHIFFSRRLFTLKLERKEKAWVPHISQGSAWQGSCLLLARGPHDRMSFLQGTALWQGTSGRGTKGRAGLNGGTDISVYSCVLFSPHAAPARPVLVCHRTPRQAGRKLHRFRAVSHVYTGHLADPIPASTRSSANVHQTLREPPHGQCPTKGWPQLDQASLQGTEQRAF